MKGGARVKRRAGVCLESAPQLVVLLILAVALAF
jgi:hypothetical protein